MFEKEAVGMLTLRVAEALTDEVGKGIARIDPKDMEKIEAKLGDIIEIIGKRSTVAKVVPAFPEYCGQGLIQIDGIIRENAKVGIDEKVEVQKVEYKQAHTIVLTPIDTTRSFQREEDLRYIGRLLTDIPIISGDKVKVTLFAARPQEFLVAGTSPKGPVVITSNTIIKIKPPDVLEKKRFATVSYEDIGGLDKEIERIREMIELPLKYPDIFARLGIEPPKGVLLYGPPGTGKTLIARAVASETDAYFVHVNGPEIMHKFYGESEARLRELFEDAKKNAPSIVFLDEIDALAPRRAEVIGDVEKRVVAQLLALMDGMVSRGEVIVIGATNMPDIVDPALRRPGRFDREIAIPVPDRKGRLKIFQIHTRGMPLAKEVDLERLAEITHGFVGADIEALCTEAGMVALRKIMPKIKYGAEYIPYETELGLEVTMGDFLEALKIVEPTATREFFMERPNVKWSDVGGLAKIKETLISSIEWPLKYPELFEYAKTGPPKGIMLSGPPGTGKTLIAKALAGESEVNFISVEGPALFSKWVGESEKALREIFKKAKQGSPCILFFDEIDALAPVRDAGGESDVPKRMVSQLLSELDGLEELKGVIVLAATNRIDMVDPALLRPGRFDLILEFPLPDEKERIEIFQIHTKGKPLTFDVDLKVLAKDTNGFAGSDIAAVCKRASTLAIREFLEKRKDSWKGDYTSFKIKARHFQVAIEETLKAKEEDKKVKLRRSASQR